MDRKPAPPTDDLLARLARHAPRESRYEVRSKLGQGGMGAILEAFDVDLRRRLAMKVLRRDGTDGAARAPDPAVVHRFLEEAQVAAQLVHPGVVPVHELGLDAEGRAFFTMALVEGSDLESVFALVREGREGWNLTRALGVLQRVCETMAYAHSRGVIHRDLKPANVMVGAFGEVYVLDWGLAKVVDVPSAPPSTRTLDTDRRAALAAEPDTSLATVDGAVVGTPSYMSPEQARGEPLDARSDVYAVGAMLYTLLAGRRPYASPGAPLNAYQVVEAIRRGPPSALGLIAPRTSPELVSITERAMARDPARRYADMGALAEDLRAYLENRVVRAHRTGAWAELSKWVRRNRGTAAALASLVVAVVAGVAITGTVRARAERRELLFADVRLAAGLVADAERLWPALPGTLPALRAWLNDAEGLIGRRDEHAELLAEVGASGDARAQQLRELNATTIPAVAALLPAVAERETAAATVEERTVRSPSAAARWREAIDSIAAAPAYRGLTIRPQIGLLPIGADPASGLWEFWHTLSGTEPARDSATGSLLVTGETGIVLVLLPGGTTAVGSLPMQMPARRAEAASWAEVFQIARESREWGEPWRDPAHESDEAFVEGLELDPFFIGKHEMTQGQWLRATGSNPSQHARLGLDHPVDTVSHDEAVDALHRLALVLPTETQWEHAARGGTTSPFWTGLDFESLQGAANIADRAGAAAQGPNRPKDVTGEIDDGFLELAPVWTLRPNPFGLHHVLGNVWEWCADCYRPDRSPRSGDGLDARAAGLGLRARAIRGGSFFTPAQAARAANRFSGFLHSNSDSDLGLRAARPLER